MQQLLLTKKDNGKTATTPVGIPITIQIEENLTTGYSWEIEQLDTTLLELEDTDYIVKQTGNPVMAGAGGQRTFTFRSKQTGSTEIRLKLWRKWAGDASIVERYAVTLQIQA